MIECCLSARNRKIYVDAFFKLSVPLHRTKSNIEQKEITSQWGFPWCLFLSLLPRVYPLWLRWGWHHGRSARMSWNLLEYSGCFSSGNLRHLLSDYLKGEATKTIEKATYRPNSLFVFIKIQLFWKLFKILWTRKSSCVNARGIPPAV